MTFGAVFLALELLTIALYACAALRRDDGGNHGFGQPDELNATLPD